MKKLLIFFAISLHSLWSNVATTENHPSAIVEGCINAITGDCYITENDIFIQGAEPIPLTRTYISNKGEGVWRFFFHLAIEKNPEGELEVFEPNGTFLVYKKDKKTDRYLPKDLIKPPKGLTNTARGKLSALTNLKNQYIKFYENKNKLTVHCPDGRKRYYRKTKKNTQPDLGSQVDDTDFHLYSEQLPNGNLILYEWDEDGRLHYIRSTDSTEKVTFAWAKIFWHHAVKEKNLGPEMHKPSFHIETSDGRKLTYRYKLFKLKENKKTKKRDKDKHWQLSEFFSTHSPKEEFEYRASKYKTFLHFLNLPEGRSMEIRYYLKGDNDIQGKNILVDSKKHPLKNRAKSLHVPVGQDYALHPILQIKYNLEKRTSEAFDIEGNVTEYKWDEEERLIAKKRYQNDQRYSDERFIWGYIGGPDASNLKYKIVKDPSDERNSFATKYEYDKQGNVIQEKLVGNLTGQSTPLTFDDKGKPKLDSAETYNKTYDYTSDSRNLLIKAEEDNGLKILYDYLPDSYLIFSEITCDGNKILQRKFYEYNEYNTLKREIHDDGTSLKKDNLTDVHTRIIKDIIPYTDGAYVGMPQILEEKYWDGKQEVLLRKTVLFYTNGGKISKKEIYDAHNTYRYTLKYKYYDQGYLILETNPLGDAASYDYDELGNKKFSKSFNGKIQEMEYDCSNRMNKLTEKGTNDEVHITLHSYDRKNNLRKTTDYLGNVTHFDYDSFGNLLQTQLSPLSDASGNTIPCIITASYDGLGRKISETDTNGHTTKTAYNVYNQPISICYPDGTEENFIYHKTGTLKTHINAEGTETHYTYDVLKRPLTKAVYAKGKKLSDEIYTYEGSNLHSYTDPEGYTTTYEYDGAGRKIAEEKEGQRTEDTYDELGRLKTIQKGELLTVKEYDLLDRVIEEREENVLNGGVFTKIFTTYDKAGNIETITRFIDDQESQETYIYDSFNRLRQKIDPLGHITTIEYDESHSFLTKKTTDPKGLQTFEYFDSHENLIETTLLGKHGERLSEEHMYYDGVGNLTQQNSVLLEGGNPKDILITTWDYDSCNRLTTLKEAAGSPKERITRFEYNTLGLLEHIHKPSGVVLTNAYDYLCRKIEEKASDHSIHHTFDYNLNNVLTEAKDLIHHTTTERKIDAYGNLIEETLGNKLTVTSTFDIHNRKETLILPT